MTCIRFDYKNNPDIMLNGIQEPTDIFQLIPLDDTYIFNATHIIYANLIGVLSNADFPLNLENVLVENINEYDSKLLADDLGLVMTAQLENIKHFVLYNASEDRLIACFTFEESISIYPDTFLRGTWIDNYIFKLTKQ